jgi:hypothetical protein
MSATEDRFFFELAELRGFADSDVWDAIGDAR